MKVLFATDGSEYAQAALDSILARPWPDRTTILVLHVVQVLSPVYNSYYCGYMEALTVVDEAGKQLGQNIVQKTVSQMKSGLPDVEVSSILTSGTSPADEIVAEARKWKADMIIVGSHGRTGLAKFFLGSVAEAVLNRAPCSVEVVRCPQNVSKGPQDKQHVPVGSK